MVAKSWMRRSKGSVVAPERKWEEQKGKKAKKEAQKAGPYIASKRKAQVAKTNADSRAGG